MIMKRTILSFSAVPAILLEAVMMSSSCIREEAKNMEADILTCTVEGVDLVQDPLITNNRVTLYVNGWEDLTSVAPEFTLTEGATIEPASGTALDFTSPQQYTVTSEDGKWTKTYTVAFSSTELAKDYHFENAMYYTYTNTSTGETSQRYQILYEIRNVSDTLFWSSGNPGYMITHSDASAAEYPTSQCDTGYVDKCVKLVTRSTGALGAMFGSPIAAGNLFLGNFKINMGNTLLSTHFGEGVPCTQEPLAVSGWYKYTRGPQMTNKENENIDGDDDFDIYASFFEPTDDVPYLDGTNVKDTTSATTTIVKFGQIQDSMKVADGEWHQFWFLLDTVSGKEIDEDKLANGEYCLTIVLSSSMNGAKFIGAVGSTLYADELKLYCEE
jgi:hypothetical protein